MVGSMAEGTRTARSQSPLGMIVAAVAEPNDCMVVKANEEDVVGLDIVNQLSAG